MRVVTVLGAVGVGLALGSAAVLAPLMTGTAGSRVETSPAGSWGSPWGQQASRAAQALMGRDTKPVTAAASREAVETVAIPAPFQDAKTIDFLAHPGGTATATATATVADARIVQNPWKAQVTVAPEAASRKLTSSKPSSDQQRDSLVRDLQVELKRVGCYEGEASGHWGASSKKAMAAFTERVNASLPYEQPDFILLTLVQGHKGRACGQDCPAGQSLAETGRCMPNSILAQAERSKQSELGRREAVAAAAATAATVAAAKLSAATKAQDRAAIASAWTTTTRPATLETGSIAEATALPRVIRPQPAADTPLVTAEAPAAAAPTRPATVLPGRMAIGAARPSASEASLARPEPTPAPVPAKPATRMAATGAAPATPPAAEPVTAAPPAPEPEQANRRQRPAQRVQPSDQVRRAPEPVTVRRPPPPPRYSAPAPPQKVAGGSKSRRMIYELFQNPNRN